MGMQCIDCVLYTNRPSASTLICLCAPDPTAHVGPESQKSEKAEVKGK